MATNAQQQRAFKAMTHAVIISIFGESPDSRAGRVDPDSVNNLDGGIVQKGLDMVMLGNRPDLGLHSLQRSGFIAGLLPDIERMVGFGGYEEGHKDLWEHTKRVVCNAPPRLEVRWAALFHDVGKPVAFRKKNGKVTFHGHEAMSVAAFQRACETTVLFPDHEFRGRVAIMIEALGHIESYRLDWTDSAVRRIRKKVEDDRVWADLLDLARSDVTSAHAAKRERCKARTDDLERRAKEILDAEAKADSLKPPKGTGDLIAVAFKIEGRALGDAMNFLKLSIKDGVIPPGLTDMNYVDFMREAYCVPNEQQGE
jgi:poly(A) polymerase